MPATDSPAQIPIAIIGLACRFPGDATSPAKFWELLRSGSDAYSPTTDRYNADAFYHPKASNRQNVLATKGGHFLKQDPYAFDAAFFNITAAEAIAFDPKQRIALEVVYEALENAGKSLHDVAGTQTACYIGSSMSDYRDAVVRDFGHSPKYHILGTCEEMISNRVSHFLDIHGPSATIHTACSSSLVATHLSCQSLQSGESEMAICGGVGMIISPDGNMQLNNLGFLNPEGHSRSFDENAGGYGRGEGCGILVLKRLDAAIADGDNIRAVIRASGVNSDGWTQGVTMPSSEAQAALIRRVYESNGLDYRATQYVEAHGTGTKVGDPAELGALHRTIGQGATKSRKLYVGSVKPNIGHLEAAAGVAGMIKGILAMEHGLIPPNIHFSKPNPAIPFEEWNMAVATRLTPWPVAPTGRRMSVSGFGMGGTNGHVVLEALSSEYRDLNKTAVTNGNGTAPPRTNGAPSMKALANGALPGRTFHEGKRLFVFSSQDRAGFKRLGNALVEHLENLGPAASTPEYLSNLAHTLAHARFGLAWRDTLIAETVSELRDKLLTDLGQAPTRAVVTTPRIGFVFTGQGAQWASMGIELLERPTFRASMAKSSEFLKEFGCTWDPIAELKKSKSESRLALPELSQPLCTVLQIAICDELRACGVRPTKVVGHSSGEIAAAYSIGALSHRDAVLVAYYRGKVASGLKYLKGGMMAVGCSPEEAKVFIGQLTSTTGRVSVACVNSPASVTISGDLSALEELQVILEDRSIFARRLKVDVAYHSAHMNAAVAEYTAMINLVEPAQATEAQPVFVSSVTGHEADSELLGPYYWVRNLISPVLFADAIKELVSPADGTGANAVDYLIEIGPHGALGGPIEQILSHHSIKGVSYRSVLTRGENALEGWLKSTSELAILGLLQDVQSANGDSDSRILSNLPPYPWNHSKIFRAESRIQREFTMQKLPTRSLLGAQLPTMAESQHEWRSFIRIEDEPWLRGHTVGSTVLFPGAGIVSIILEAAQELAESGKTISTLRLRDVNLFAAMALSDDQATEVIIHFRPHLLATTGTTPAAWWEFTVSSCVGTDQLRDNARGLVTVDYAEEQSLQMVSENDMRDRELIADYHSILAECPDTYPKDRFYQHMTTASWSYGELFQGVENCHPGYGKTTFDIRLVDIGETFSKDQLSRPFLINAASLDAVFQSWLGATYSDGAFEFDKPFVPTSIKEFEISVDIPADADYIMPGLCRAERYGFNELTADIACFDKYLSKVFLSVKDFRTSELDMDASKQTADGIEVDPADITSVIQWDYALDLLYLDEIRQILTGLTYQDAVTKLVHLILHNKPATKVTELISRANDIADAALSKLPQGVVVPSLVRYAVARFDKATADVSCEFLSLGEDHALAPSSEVLADLVIVSDQGQDAVGIERLFDLSKQRLSHPGAMVIVVSKMPIADPLLTSENLDVVFASEEGLNIAFWHTERHHSINGEKASQEMEAIIVQPKIDDPVVSKFTSGLTSLLESQGYSVQSKPWANGLSSDEVKGKTVISLLELQDPILDNLSEKDFEIIRTIILECQRLLWVTSGGSPSMHLVDGLARCIRSEIASTKFQLLDLVDSISLDHGPSLAARVLESSTDDDEFKAVNGLLQVGRISRSQYQNDNIRFHLEDSVRVLPLADQHDPLRLSIGKPGLLDTLRFVSDDRMHTPLGDNEVEIKVKATGLNFRDVMACMALIPVQWLGQEASGVITRTGSNVTDWTPGDRVCTIHVGTHATVFRTDQRGLARIPDAMSFEEAASLPVVNMTAYYAFVSVARLRRGQSVLIHAAAGGVGQAAIQMAKYLGLVIYATVGSEDKRMLLTGMYDIPDEHIFHSRDASFVKGIHRITNGRGVDCVLNQLSGELLRASWNCLATFGTFVEIGLRDITNNMRLDMRPFGKSTSFTFINNHTLFTEDPETFYHVYQETFALVNQGVLRAPSHVAVYPINRMEEAFRTMQQGKHRGKLVLSFQNDARAPVLRKAKDSLRLDPQATYLFVGGLGGLGRSLAKEFVACGARNLAFVSRSGISSPQAAAVVEELEKDGARVKAYCCDASDGNSFKATMDQVGSDLPPVKGVIQMAMVLRDIVFEKMSYEEWTTPVKPKVQGTWNLHEYFGHERPLDFMVICSSSSGIYGYPSQAQYASGNTYQDALAHYRHAQGLKAVSVNLGIMRDVGVLAETGTSGNIRLWEEVLGIREPAFHALMKSLINQQIYPSLHEGAPQVCTGLGTADIMAAHSLARPEYFNDPRFGPLAVLSEFTGIAAANGQETSTSLASQLARAESKEQAIEIVTEALVNKTAEILQMPSSEVDSTRPLYRYGVDSLVALEVRNWITREMKANMALLEILAAVPIQSFAAKIVEKSKLVTVA